MVSINAVFGESGLIKRAQEAKDITANSVIAEQEELDKLFGEVGEIMGELPVAPKLSDGMIPVKWNGTNWIKTTSEDKDWYNYANKEWANIVLEDATFTTSGSEEILDESKAYSMLVWIPRYAYQITSQYHQSGSTAGNINVVFIDTNNQNKDKSKTYNETYPSYSTGSGMTDYVVHPAFNYGGNKLSGFWVGKYETSSTEGNSNSSSGDNVTSKTVQIKAGVSSWRHIEISNIFAVCTELNKTGNPYGLSTDDNVVDPHLIKNSEWGACAYLSQNSKYGKGSEVWINNSSNFITGNAGNSVSANSTSGTTNSYSTNNGMQASTTGNITGVYDMSGGTHEIVAAYVNNGKANLTKYGEKLVSSDAKYKDVYTASATDGNDSQSENYNLSIPTKGKYGDAVYETSSSTESPFKNSWYSDFSIFSGSDYIYFPDGDQPFFSRGGRYNDGSGAGVFYFSCSDGGNSTGNNTFRLVIPVI